MEPTREKIKSILTCLDEGDYPRASSEFQREFGKAEYKIDQRIKYFLGGVINLVNQNSDASQKYFRQFVDLIPEKENDGIAQVIREFGTILFNFCTKGKIDLVRLTPIPDDIISFHNVEQIKITRDIILGIIDFEKGISDHPETAVDKLKDLYEIEIQPEEVTALNIFEKLYTEDQIALFIFEFMAWFGFRLLTYQRYLNNVETIFKLSSKEKKDEIVSFLRNQNFRIEPRSENKGANTLLYTELKKTLNQIYFLWFVDNNDLENGYKYIESLERGGGMDFLRVEEKCRITDDENQEEQPNLHGLHVRIFNLLRSDSSSITDFVVPEKYHPYKLRKEDLVRYHGVADSCGDILEMDRHVYQYHSAVICYTTFIKNFSSLGLDIKNSIYDHIINMTIEVKKWVDLNDEYIRYFYYPFELCELLEERGQYDCAIYLYQNSTGDNENIISSIDRCKHLRDGFIYDKLKSVLRNLNEQEQKQLIAYSQLFKVELKLRQLVENLGKDWWVKDKKLQDVVDRCRSRETEFEGEIYFRQNIPRVGLIHFTTLPELVRIITINWGLFEQKLKSKDHFGSLMDTIKTFRISIAHLRFLDEMQLQKLEEAYESLNRVINYSEGGKD